MYVVWAWKNNNTFWKKNVSLSCISSGLQSKTISEIYLHNRFISPVKDSLFRTYTWTYMNNMILRNLPVYIFVYFSRLFWQFCLTVVL